MKTYVNSVFLCMSLYFLDNCSIINLNVDYSCYLFDNNIFSLRCLFRLYLIVIIVGLILKLIFVFADADIERVVMEI